MATKKAAPDPSGEPKKGGKRKIFLLGTSAILLVGGGVGGGLYASKAFSPQQAMEDPRRPKLVERDENGAEADAGDDKEPAPKVGTVSVTSDAVKVDPKKFEVTYVALEQPFTANLANGGIIQVGVSFATYYDDRVVQNLKRQTVPIRSAALMVLSEQDPEALSTAIGKLRLQRQLTAAVNRVLREKEGFGGVENVYFTSLVIQ